MNELAELAERAKTGDRDALERLLLAVRDDIYNLALRMLWHPADAEDATQEILIRVLTGLGGYRGETAFTTWVFRIPTNHLLTTTVSIAWPTSSARFSGCRASGRPRS